MRSTQEQLDGLMKLAEQLGAAACNFYIINEPGDVAAIRVDVPERREVVYADGGYDLWGYDEDQELHILKNDLSAKDAALELIKAYKEHKIDTVMRRLCGPDWQKRTQEFSEKLDHVRIQVWGQTSAGYPLPKAPLS